VAAVREESGRRLGLIALLLIAPGALALDTGAIAPLLGPLSRQFASTDVAQRIVVAPLLGHALGGLSAGWIIGRLGVRRSFLAAAFAYALVGGVGLVAPSPSVLFAGAALLGVLAVIIGVASGLVLAANYAGTARGRMIGYQNASAGLIAAVGIYASGVIAEAAGWRASFLLFVGLGLAIGAVALLEAGRIEATEREERSARFRELLPVAPLLAAAAVVLLVAITSFTHVSLLLESRGIRSPATASGVITVQGLMSMVGAAFYGALAARIGKYATAALGVLAGAAGLIVSGLYPSVPVLAAGCAGIGIALGFILPCIADETIRLSTDAVRPQALGFLHAAQFAGGFANPFLVKPLSAAFGVPAMYVILGSAFGLLGLAFVALRTAVRRPANAA
jgi:MFS family permease